MSLSQQLLLDLKLPQQASFASFVTGSNSELIKQLQGLACTGQPTTLYLWGSDGCGKSHLLAATAAYTNRNRLLLGAKEVGTDLPNPADSVLIIDDVQELSDDAQIALFRTFIAARELKLSLLIAGNAPPLNLQLREDLRTRIGQMLIYEIQALTDDDKIAALNQQAKERGMSMDPAIANYLLRHGRRDLPSLIALLNALDKASLEQKRPPTLPLLRELMQSTLQFEN